MRILIFVVAYNAEKHITDTLSRIPKKWIAQNSFETLILDDASTDETMAVIADYIGSRSDLHITFLSNDQNLGYGGNQKKGYDFALKNNYDLVVLLHGDGQYAPEFLPQIIEPIVNRRADVVLGSRMINKFDALKGRMPFYKWVGNLVLTKMQNLMLGTQLSEFHTGYRAFNISALRGLPLDHNSNYYDFDTEIIIQLLDTGARIEEISIPTFYGDEVSYVNGFKYAWLILYTTLKSRLVRRGLLVDKRFKYSTDS